MLRACLTIAAVIGICVGIVCLRDVQGDAGSASASPSKASVSPLAWVRTIDGWEPSSVLQPVSGPAGPPSLHPGVVASLQLGVSLFALLALPTATRCCSKS